MRSFAKIMNTACFNIAMAPTDAIYPIAAGLLAQTGCCPSFFKKIVPSRHIPSSPTSLNALSSRRVLRQFCHRHKGLAPFCQSRLHGKSRSTTLCKRCPIHHNAGDATFFVVSSQPPPPVNGPLPDGYYDESIAAARVGLCLFLPSQ